MVLYYKSSEEGSNQLRSWEWVAAGHEECATYSVLKNGWEKRGQVKAKKI